VFEVAASALSTVAYVGGSAAGTETLRAGAYDGALWSAWQAFNVTTQVNQAPVVGSASFTLTAGDWRLVSLSAYDPDGDTITLYRVRDTNTDTDSGHFWSSSVGDISASDSSWHEITPVGFQNLWVNGGLQGQTDIYQVQAYDGQIWSATGTITAAVPGDNPAPENPSQDTQGESDNVESVQPALAGSTALAAGDTLTGGAHDDVLTGGPGNDLFVFNDGSGADTVQDFQSGPLSDDVLDVSAFGFGDLAGLLAATSQQGSNAVIALDSDDQVTLIGVHKSGLHADDFQFV
jgi:hypothetical protein